MAPNLPSLKLIAMLGGTFDPVHCGHLRTALELTQTLPLERLLLVPCHRPPHRETPGCTAQQRLQMVRLAVAGETRIEVDARELLRDRPSYSVDTLTELRQEYGAETALAMVVGMDSFLGLPTWHRWQRLFELAHIIVVCRPGWPLPQRGVMAELLQQRQVEHAEQLRRAPAGRILLQPLPTQLAISATFIREQISQGLSARFLVPDSVWDYIQRHRLYRQDGAECPRPEPNGLQ